MPPLSPLPIRLSVYLALGAILLGMAAGSARAADTDAYQPYIEPASAEGERAIAGFQVPNGLKVELFAAEPLLANPVAFCLDERGRVFVAETFRLEHGAEDNRDAHADWIDEDLAAQTVEDR